MATAVASRGPTAAAMAPPEAPKEVVEYIPDIIVENRKDAEGRLVTYQYARGKLLGKGGFAKCFLGTLVTTKQPYALKIVAKGTLAKARAKQKLQTEIKIHKTLRHVNVVRFDRYFEDNNNVYMLLELCVHNSMSDMMKRRKKLTDVETRYYLLQLIGALKYLHDNLVIHRDLKLGNLFIDAQMRIKVGDFGLATRLTDPSERKKTVCGTPNYIAPEILEGKSGHSFEVDVWSTGVILYTLLVGKPPFESKDVKSTYKRILANSYAFPDHVVVCEHAKNLIRHILQTKPELRPSLDALLDHSFFSRPGAFTPAQLPESALRDPPTYSHGPADAFSAHHAAPAKFFAGPESHGAFSGHDRAFGHPNDENDPGAINRPYAPGTTGQPLPKPRLFSSLPEQPNAQGRPRTAPAAPAAGALAPTFKFAAPADAQDHYRYGKGDGGAGSSSRPLTAGTAAAPSSSAASTVLPGVSSSSRSASSHSGDGTTSARANPQAPTRREPSSRPSSGGAAATAAPGVPSGGSSSGDKRPYASIGKFDIYQDGKQAQAGSAKTSSGSSSSSSSSATAALRDASASSRNSNNTGSRGEPAATFKAPPAAATAAQPTGFHRGAGPAAGGQGASSSGSHGGAAIGIDQLQAGFEVVQLGDDATRNAAAAAAASRGRVVASVRVGGGDGRLRESARPQAWVEDELHPMYYCLPGNGNKDRPGPQTYYVSARGEPGAPPAAPAAPAEAMQLGTPPEPLQVKATHDANQADAYKALGTLETMHDTLAARGLDDVPLDAFDGAQRQAQMGYHPSTAAGTGAFPSPAVLHRATVWVVRYVDYTSKYGLGFLLNTGSAGVYFNDSTKIVLSPDGSVFQYIERRRKDVAPPAGVSATSEHITQTHLVSYYPSELQKKVTLLRHFRNYLVDQQREGASRAEDGSAAGGSQGMETIAMASLDGTNSGASSSVPFGVSSVALKPADCAAMFCVPPGNQGTSRWTTTEPEMPFLKKWVRTRHAILFRLSNRTVQVLFFDRSEVLLSSEARAVTYVNKQGARSEHTLEEVLQLNRTDIAKRLKYAKDIMYRLISTTNGGGREAR